MSFRFQWLMAFVTLKFANNINDALNVSGGYFLFGSLCFFSTMFVIYFAPETKEKTNDEMKHFFLSQRNMHGRMIQMGVMNGNSA